MIFLGRLIGMVVEVEQEPVKWAFSQTGRGSKSVKWCRDGPSDADVFQNGDEEIDGDGAPDLGAHGVGRRAVKGLDAQMLLDPFEEEFDLPATTIELSNGQRWPGEIVGQEDEEFASFGIAIRDAAQRDRIIVLSLQASHHAGLINPQAGGFVHGAGVTAGAAEVLPWPG